MTDREDIDMLAAEYVLGTLDHTERSGVAVRRLLEPGLEVAILAWERRLIALNEHVDDVQPSADLFDRIETELVRQAGTGSPHPSMAAENILLRRRVTRWRIAAVAMTAIAAALASLLVYNGASFPVLQ